MRLDLGVYRVLRPWSDYVYYAWSAGAGYAGRLQRLFSGVGSGANGLQKLTYAYDPVGNLTRLRDDNNSSQRQCFQYDPLDRLTRATTSADTGQGVYGASGRG